MEPIALLPTLVQFHRVQSLGSRSVILTDGAPPTSSRICRFSEVAPVFSLDEKPPINVHKNSVFR